MPPPFLSSAPIITVLMRANDMAAAHIAQGSKVTYRVVSGMRCAPLWAQASRIARISAWAQGSFNSRVRLPALAMILPFSSIIIAPMGTSSRISALFASSNALCIWVWS